MTAELRLGSWERALADVRQVDVLITDPPYSARTHDAQCYGRRGGGKGYRDGWVSTTGLEYPSWSAADVRRFVNHWSPRTRGWLCAFTDSELYPSWRDALRKAGRYVFHPIPCVMPGMNVRLAGDGPSSWCVWLVVARPRVGFRWRTRTLDGAYWCAPGAGSERAKLAVRGAKPLALMRAIVRDYSCAGELVCDPCAGGATTLLAAVTEGRRGIGAELDPVAHGKALARLARGYTPMLDLSADGVMR